MSDAPTHKMTEIAARSDANFDGRDFDGLSAADRKRYLARSEAALQAVMSHVLLHGYD